MAILDPSHRLHKHLHAFCIACDAFWFAQSKLSGHELPEETRIGLAGTRSYDVTISGLSAFKRAIRGDPPGPVELFVSRKSIGVASLAGKTIRGPLGGLATLFNDTMSAQFVLFYESHKSCAKLKTKPVWNFARVVRNAVSHCNTIHINKKNHIPVSWHDVVYDYGSNGRDVIGHDLHASDIILLMIDMNTALDKLGCP